MGSWGLALALRYLTLAQIKAVTKSAKSTKLIKEITKVSGDFHEFTILGGAGWSNVSILRPCMAGVKINPG